MIFLILKYCLCVPQWTSMDQFKGLVIYLRCSWYPQANPAGQAGLIKCSPELDRQTSMLVLLRCDGRHLSPGG